ncbi:MAG: hypothetical protein NC402_06450 [Prevotella sp.]|nr:hypothetical protein [Prevotella sp.]MCM1075341.1 hypothetical protein [Ruminococcus sp.]
MKKFWSYIIMTIACISLSAMDLQAARSWESQRVERFSEGRIVTRTSEIEICTLPGIIMINTSKPVQVKVFSILGQLVSSSTIPAGVSQLNLGTHGLFIVKAGDITCKVAL